MTGIDGTDSSKDLRTDRRVGQRHGGRFDEPLFHRACQSSESAETATWCRDQVARLSGSVIYEAIDN